MLGVRENRHAFTLIELLIVVAIIAILAAIAVPNFLEAQTRSKVSRVKSDLRTLATALETYTVDANRCPLEEGTYAWVGATLLSTAYIKLTSPIAYITSIPSDPFNHGGVPAGWGGIVNPNEKPAGQNTLGYGYTSCWTASGPQQLSAPWLVAKYGADSPNNVKWIVWSNGPQGFFYKNTSTAGQEAWGGLDGDPLSAVYDPTNGTVSGGHIWDCSLGMPN